MEKRIVLIGANDLLLAGVQRLVVDQTRLLDRNRYAIHLVVLMTFTGRETFDHLIPNDVIVHRLSFRGLADIGQWLALVRVLARVRPDVVKTATFFSNAVFLSLRPFFGYEVIAAEHNTVNRKPAWQRLADRILLPQARTIIADSAMVADFISKAEGIERSRFTVVYNGVDLERIEKALPERIQKRSQIRSALGISDDAFVFLTVARIVKQKNHALMINAFARLHAAHKNTHLVIVGEGGLLPELEAQVERLSLSGFVHLPGETKDVPPYYLAADAFVLTSRHEGFCIVAMEGLAYGLPLVSTNVAGVQEYLEDGINGFFAEAVADDIAHKMEHALLLDTDERARFSEAGKRTASGYSVERYGKELNRLVADALA